MPRGLVTVQLTGLPTFRLNQGVVCYDRFLVQQNDEPRPRPIPYREVKQHIDDDPIQFGPQAVQRAKSPTNWNTTTFDESKNEPRFHPKPPGLEYTKPPAKHPIANDDGNPAPIRHHRESRHSMPARSINQGIQDPANENGFAHIAEDPNQNADKSEGHYRGNKRWPYNRRNQRSQEQQTQSEDAPAPAEIDAMTRNSQPRRQNRRRGRNRRKPYRPRLHPAVARLLPKQFTGQFRLMDLPAEIQVQIFQYVFDGALVLGDRVQTFGIWPKSTYPVKSYNEDGISFDLFPSYLLNQPEYSEERLMTIYSKMEFRGKPLNVIGPYWKHPTPEKRNTALIFTCKQVAGACLKDWYSRSVFVFGNRKKLDKFVEENHPLPRYPTKVDHTDTPVRTLDFKNLTFLRHLCVEIRAYGQPGQAWHDRLQQKYYRNWCCTIDKICERMTGLEDLSINAHVPISQDDKKKCPLSLEAMWAQPVLSFEDCKNLKTVAITLSIPYTPHLTWDIAAGFAEVLRRKILRWDDETALNAFAEEREKSRKQTYWVAGWKRGHPLEWMKAANANGMDDIPTEGEENLDDAAIMTRINEAQALEYEMRATTLY